MFSFLGDSARDSLALLVDIGSGSVGIALMHYQPDEAVPKLLWSHREFAGINDTVRTPTLKVIRTAVFNAFLEFDSNGKKQLPEHLTLSDITATQVLINAPWVYTVTKKVSYSQEHSFSITNDLIKELKEAALADTEAALADVPNFKNLEIIQSHPIAVIANGYITNSWDNATARTLTIDYLTSLTDTSLIEVVRDVHSKIAPKTTLTIHSHIAALYESIKYLHPEILETCLLTVTSEGTEIGIVRNGILEHITNIPQGSFTIARAVAVEQNIPTGEAFGYLRESDTSIEKQPALAKALASYTDALATAFTNTGDALSIPKTIYTHMNIDAKPILMSSIKQAAEAVTGQKHTVHYLTGEILNQKDFLDTSLLIAAYFYMLQEQRRSAEE